MTTDRMSIPLTVSQFRRARGTQILIRVTGEVDLVTAPELAEELRAAQRSALADPVVLRIVVDLRPSRFFGCRGVSVLLDADRRGPRPRVVTNNRVARHLRLMGVDSMLELCTDPDDPV